MPPYFFWFISFVCLLMVAVGLGARLASSDARARWHRRSVTVGAAVGGALATCAACSLLGAGFVWMVAEGERCDQPTSPLRTADILGVWTSGSAVVTFTPASPGESGGTFLMRGFYQRIPERRGEAEELTGDWRLLDHNIDMTFDVPRSVTLYADGVRLCGNAPPYELRFEYFLFDPDLPERMSFHRQ